MDKKRDVVILLGNTGTGKSTVSKFLRRDPTLKIERNSGRKWIFTDGDSKIGDLKSHVSKTLIPNLDVDEETGVQLIDFAGFQDTRSVDFDLLTEFFNKKILDSSVKVKIVLVEKYSNLKQIDERNTFTQMLKQTANLIGPNLDSFEGSLGLIATRVDDRSDDDEAVLHEITAFINETIEFIQNKRFEAILEGDKKNAQEYSRQVRLLEFMLEGGNMQPFWNPITPQMESMDENRRKLRKFVLEKLNVSKLFEHEFQVTVAAETVNFINKNMLERSENAMEKEFKKLGVTLLKNLEESTGVNLQPRYQLTAASVIQICKDYIKIVDAVDSLKQVVFFAKRRNVNKMDLSEIHFEVDKTKFFYQVVGRDFSEIEKNAITDLKSTLVTNITKEMHFNYFLELLMDDFGTYEFQHLHTPIDEKIARVNVDNFRAFAANLISWSFSEKTALLASGLSPTKTNIEALKHMGLSLQNSDVEVETRGTIVIFSSRFIVMSRIKDKIQKNSDASEIVLIAGEKLFVDCDLTLNHTHLKITAPVVEVVEEPRNIYLRGEDGKNNLGTAASCVRGAAGASNGVQGNAGFSSGNFNLLALEVKNGELLSVTTKGGDGGVGQNGGDGCNFKPFPWPRKIKYTINSNSITDNLWSYPIVCWPLMHFTHASTCSLHWFKLNIYYSGLFGVEDAVRLKQDNLAPTIGGDSGIGGSAALPGTQRLLLQHTKAIQNIKNISQKGQVGAAGQVGRVGVTGANCTYMNYECKVHCHTSDIPAECTSLGSYEFDGSDFTVFNDRPSNNQSPEIIMRHKFQEGNLYEQAFEFFSVSHRLKFDLVADNSMGQFLSFLLTSDHMISQFKPQDYLKMIEKAEFIVGNTKQSDLQYTTQRLHFFYSAMLQSVRKWRQQRSESASAEDAEMTLFSLLDTLQSFLHGKQAVVRLSDSVDAQLSRLSNIDEAIEQVGKFEGFASDKHYLLSKIDQAKELMQKLYQRKMDDNQGKLDAELSELLQKHNQMNKQTDKALIDHREEVGAQLLKNVALSVVDSICMFTGILYSPVAIVRPMISKVTQAVATVPPSLQVESPDLEEHEPNILKYAELVFKNLEFQKAEQHKYYMSTVKDIIDADNNQSFLKHVNREKIVAFIAKAIDVNSVHAIEVAGLLNAVELDLKTKIAELKKCNGDSKEIDKWNSINKSLQTTMYIANSGFDVARIIRQYSNDQPMLDQVENASKQHNGSFQEMAVYEEHLHRMFKPLFKQIVEHSESLGSNLKTQTEFEWHIPQTNFKSYARKCISIVQKLTQYFLIEDDEFILMLTELQELLTTLVDAYDKIEELRYRMPVADFMGKLSGVECLTANDPDTCNSFKKTSKSIRRNELVRDFAQVFAAYKQASFPFGASRMQLLNASHLLLCTAPNEKVSKLLRSGLETMRDDLMASSLSTQNHQDVDVVFTKFSSQFISTQPFFVWPNDQYSHQIAELLSGERVTLVASVSAPYVKNAAKFHWVALNITSKDQDVARQVHSLLKHFRVEMVRSGESYFRCNSAIYAIGGGDLNFTTSFERDVKGEFVTENRVHRKLSMSDVSLSPYNLWKFKLVSTSQEDHKAIFAILSLLANKVDLELVGEGNYVAEDAAICKTDLQRSYKYVGII